MDEETKTPQENQDVQQDERAPDFEVINVGANQISIQAGASQEARQKAIQHYMSTPEFYSSIDRKTGSNYDVRNAVGSALKPEDKLNTLRQFYPDAQHFDDDNFVYTDPESGRIKLHNPKGLDIGDVFGFARELSIAAGSTLGAIAGGTVGAAAGLPAGPAAIATGAGGAAAGAGWGAAATAGVYDFLAEQFGSTVRTENVLERTAGLATEGLGAAAGQRIGEIVIPKAISGAKKVLGGGTAKAQAIYEMLTARGITPTAGAVTGGRGTGRIETALDQAAASSTTMRNQIESVVSESEQAVKALAAKVGKARSQQGAGQAIQSAAYRSIEKFKVEQRALEDKLSKEIGEDAMFSIDELRNFYSELQGFAGEMPGFSKQAYGSIMGTLDTLLSDAAENGGRVPYSAFRQIRTFFGEKMSDMTEGVNRGIYKRLYAAMSDDLRAGAELRGLGGMFDETIAFTRNFKTEYSDLLEKMTDLDAPEKGYRFLLNSRRDGGTFFKKLKDQFTSDEWGDVSATIIQKMGYKNFGNEADDAFSVNTFLTNYQSIADEAKAALFTDIPNGKAISQSLDELVTVFGEMAKSQRLGNFSNTAGAAHTLQLMDALGGDLTKIVLGATAIGGHPGIAAAGLAATVMGKVVTPLAASKLITNPAFVRWLAEGPAVKTGAQAGQHMGRLLAVYKANPEIRDALDEFFDKMNSTEINQNEVK